METVNDNKIRIACHLLLLTHRLPRPRTAHKAMVTVTDLSLPLGSTICLHFSEKDRRSNPLQTWNKVRTFPSVILIYTLRVAGSSYESCIPREEAGVWYPTNWTNQPVLIMKFWNLLLQQEGSIMAFESSCSLFMRVDSSLDPYNKNDSTKLPTPKHVLTSYLARHFV